MNVVIRADGGAGIGFGHLIRTSVIARRLVQSCSVTYLCDERYADGATFLVKQGFSVVTFHSAYLAETIDSLKPTLVIGDSYGIDANICAIFNERVPYRVYIDDLGRYYPGASIVINQNFAAETVHTPHDPETSLLFGTEYLLLRPEFVNLPPILIAETVQTVLVTIGGSDRNNILDTILENIHDLPVQYKVVIGPDFPHAESVIGRWQSETIQFYRTPPMAELMVQCDCAITACGSTVYELGVLGIPMVGFVVAENQYALAEQLNQAEAILYSKNYADLKFQLEQLLNDYALRQKCAEKTTQLFNRHGVDRVIDALLSLQRDEPIRH